MTPTHLLKEALDLWLHQKSISMESSNSQIMKVLSYFSNILMLSCFTAMIIYLDPPLSFANLRITMSAKGFSLQSTLSPEAKWRIVHSSLRTMKTNHFPSRTSKPQYLLLLRTVNISLSLYNPKTNFLIHMKMNVNKPKTSLKDSGMKISLLECLAKI